MSTYPKVCAAFPLALVMLSGCPPLGPAPPESESTTEPGVSTSTGDTDPVVTTGTTGASSGTTNASPSMSTSSGTDPSSGVATTDTTDTMDSTGAEDKTGSDASTGTPPAACDPLPAPGEPLGPCRLAVDPAGLCDGDALCLATEDGGICQPTCTDCFSGAHDACIDALSEVPPEGRFECFVGQGCDLACVTNDDCAEPLVCSDATDPDGDFKACVWPDGGGDGDPPVAPPCEEWGGGEEFVDDAPGGIGGPCTSVPDCAEGLTCVVGQIGGRCAPDDCPPSPCLVAIGCHELHPAMLCDPSTTAGWTCVWPWSFVP